MPDALPIAHLLASNVRRLRVDQALSQEGLADRMGIPFQRISLIENGRANLTLRSLASLAAALGVGVSELFRPVD